MSKQAKVFCMYVYRHTNLYNKIYCTRNNNYKWFTDWLFNKYCCFDLGATNTLVRHHLMLLNYESVVLIDHDIAARLPVKILKLVPMPWRLYIRLNRDTIRSVAPTLISQLKYTIQSTFILMFITLITR